MFDEAENRLHAQPSYFGDVILRSEKEGMDLAKDAFDIVPEVNMQEVDNVVNQPT